MKGRYKLILVAGARPNFMKIAPLMHALENHSTIEPVLVHTGQHYDENMSQLFFRQLNIPAPNINLKVGSASHALQTARIMEHFEKVCIDIKPDMVMVFGDVNSTAACTLVASKLGTKTAHYEAGLRSHDRSMPEEINRIVTDAICEYFFTTSQDANENLIKEGKNEDNIFLVGNLMIDTLNHCLEMVNASEILIENIESGQTINFSEKFRSKKFGVLTFHRPSNVDDSGSLEKLIIVLCKISSKIPLIFPVHPRTYKNIKSYGLMSAVDNSVNLILTKPVGYLDFISMVKSSKFIITDSGGIQEEATVLDIPCLTVRPNTERPITVWEGTNKLIGINEIEYEVEEILKGNGKKGKAPHLWDGNTAGRILNILKGLFQPADETD